MNQSHKKFLQDNLPMLSFSPQYICINSKTLSNMIKPCLRLKRYKYTITGQNSMVSLSTYLDSMHVQKYCHGYIADHSAGLEFSHRVSYGFLEALTRLPKNHQLILAYDCTFNWIVVKDTVTGYTTKCDCSEEHQPVTTIKYDKKYNYNNKLLAVDRKELIKALQCMTSDYIYPQYNPETNKFVIMDTFTMAEVKANEVQ